MASETSTETPPRKLNLPLALGLFFFPLVFGLLLLRAGYSRRARTFAAACLLVSFLLFWSYYESGFTLREPVNSLPTLLLGIWAEIVLGGCVLLACARSSPFPEGKLWTLGVSNPVNLLLALGCAFVLSQPSPAPETGPALYENTIGVVLPLFTGLVATVTTIVWVAIMKAWLWMLARFSRQKSSLLRSYLLTLATFLLLAVPGAVAFKFTMRNRIDEIVKALPSPLPSPAPAVQAPPPVSPLPSVSPR